MVVAHAVVAGREAARLQRLKKQLPEVGGISLVTTVTVLKKAAGGEHLPNKDAMRDLYSRLRRIDDGLLPIAQTGLMDMPIWDPRVT